MKAGAIAGGILVLVCVAELWVLGRQHGQLAGLRDDQQKLNQQSAAGSATARASTAQPEGATARVVATPEMLRLRAEVTRLEGRRRELAYVSTENGRLHAQLASAGTNGSGMAAGYLRTSEARFAGDGSPEDTMQSFLWAIRNHDSAHFLQAFTAEEAKKLSENDTFEQQITNMNALVGMRIVETHQLEDGSVSAKIKIDPGLQDETYEAGGSLKFQRVNGEWKIAGELNEPDQ